MDENLKKSTRYFSCRQEKAVARQLNGQQVSNSGATPFAKGDVITQDWLIECKTVTTQKKSFSVKEEWLSKNSEEAFAMGKTHSALCFDFGPNTDRYYVLSEKDFRQYVSLLKEETYEY